MLGIAGLLPLLFFAAFAAPAFDSGDNGPEPTDPENPPDNDTVDPGGDDTVTPSDDTVTPGTDTTAGQDTVWTGFAATMASDGGAAMPVDPAADSSGNLALDGTAGDDAISVDPDAAADLIIAPADVADTVTADLFHSVIADGDGAADAVEISVTEDALAAAAGDTVPAGEDGFVSRLDPQDMLEINLDPAVEGTLLALEIEYVNDAANGLSDDIDYALGFYVLPPGQSIPIGQVQASEDAFISGHGLQKIGALDLGNFTSLVDLTSGQTMVLNDTRQVDLPQILSNRSIVTASVSFL